MTLMKAILDRLPTLRNSQDFSTIVPELRDRLSVVEAEADDLRCELEDTLFAAPEKRDAVRNKMAANQAEQEELKIAIAGAERRQKEAATAEEKAALERRAKEAKKVQSALLADYIQLHEHLAAAAKLLGDTRVREEELRSINAVLSQHKRSDLIVRSPWWHLNGVLGEKMAGHVYQHPNGTVIPGYFPNRHPDGPALERIKDVKLP